MSTPPKSIVIESRFLNIMLKPIRIDFTSIWKKKKRHCAEIHIGRTHSIDSGCYCYSWFLKPATGQLSRHTTFICKHIKKKSPNKRRLKKKKTSGAVQWQWYTISLLREVTVGIHTLNYTLRESADLLW